MAARADHRNLYAWRLIFWTEDDWPHSLRRTKATLIYRRTGNLRAVQLLLGHTKIESTVRYLGIEVDDALSIAEHVDL
jgi:integrase